MNNLNMNQANTQAFEDIVIDLERRAAEYAEAHSNKLRRLTEAHRRERFIDWYDYGEDEPLNQLLAAHYEMIGERKPDEMAEDEYRDIIGIHYDRLTDEERAEIERQIRQEDPEFYFDDHFHSVDMIEARRLWDSDMSELTCRAHEFLRECYVPGSYRTLDDPDEAHKLCEWVRMEISRIASEYSPHTFCCDACGQMAHSHDEAGALIAGVGLWALSDGRAIPYIICEACAAKPTEVHEKLGQHFAEWEAAEREAERQEYEELQKLLAGSPQAATSANGTSGTVGQNSGSQAHSGTHNGPQAQANAPVPGPQAGVKASSAAMPRSDRLIMALQSLGMVFRLNRLEDTIEVNGERLDDVKESAIRLRMRDLGFSRADTTDAINVLAGRDAYDPVEDYLLGLRWDGQNHVGRMLNHLYGDGTMIHYNSGDHPLHAALISRWMAGAVARALDRGKSTFNHQTPMLVLIGPQGIGKSSWVRWLTSGIGIEYHRESPVNPHDPEHIRSMVNKWIWEVSELGSSLRRTDRDSLKSFITQEWHTYRKPWGKYPITKPTLCNFVGTLNPENGFLDDPTGHRRFLPVVIESIDHNYSKVIDINQVWAQVVHHYRTGQVTPELNAAERAALADVYKKHEVENPLETYINMYFDVDPSNTAWKAHTATIVQRLREFGVMLPADPKIAGRKINDVLVTMGLRLQENAFWVNNVRGRGYYGIQPNAKVPPTYKGFP